MTRRMTLIRHGRPSATSATRLRVGGREGMLSILVEVWGVDQTRHRGALEQRLAKGMMRIFESGESGVTQRLRRAMQAGDRWLRRVIADDAERSKKPSMGNLGAGASLIFVTEDEVYLAQAGPSLAFGMEMSSVDPEIEYIPSDSRMSVRRYPDQSPWLRRGVESLEPQALWTPLGMGSGEKIEAHLDHWRFPPGSSLLLAPSRVAGVLNRALVTPILNARSEQAARWMDEASIEDMALLYLHHPRVPALEASRDEAYASAVAAVRNARDARPPEPGSAILNEAQDGAAAVELEPAGSNLDSTSDPNADPTSPFLEPPPAGASDLGQESDLFDTDRFDGIGFETQPIALDAIGTSDGPVRPVGAEATHRPLDPGRPSSSSVVGSAVDPGAQSIPDSASDPNAQIDLHQARRVSEDTGTYLPDDLGYSDPTSDGRSLDDEAYDRRPLRNRGILSELSAATRRGASNAMLSTARVLVGMFPKREDSGPDSYAVERSRLAAAAVVGLPLLTLFLTLLMSVRADLVGLNADASDLEAARRNSAQIDQAASEAQIVPAGEPGILRLTALKPLGRLPGEREDPRQLVVEGNVAYILNPVLGRVDRILLDAASQATGVATAGPKEVIVTGNSLADGSLVGGLDALFWIPVGEGGRPEAGRGAVIDEADRLYSLETGAFEGRLDIATNPAWTSVEHLTGYSGMLYALDRSTGQVYRYQTPADAFPHFRVDGQPWLNQPADFVNARDMAVNGAVYVLAGNSKILKFVSGGEARFEPQGFLDNGDGGGIINAVALSIGNVAGPVMVADRGNGQVAGRILVLDAEGNYSSTILGPVIDQGVGQRANGRFDYLHDIWWDLAGRRLFILDGQELYVGGMPSR